jgi:hypothetical protein
MDLNSSSSGVAAMLRFALYAEDELGIATLELGRQGLDRKDSCTWIGTGKHLCFHVMIDGGFVFVSAQLMDLGEEPLALATFSDTKQGWQDTLSLIAALERNEVRSLQKPIEAGLGENGWVIG